MNNNKSKILIIILVVATIVITLMGGTLAYLSWQSSETQNTAVTFTVGSGFSCSADGGGNITSSDVKLAPAPCTNSDYAIKREIKVNVQKNGTNNVYLDMYLNVNSISDGLKNTQNFKYALTTSATSCGDGLIKEGNFSGATTNTHKALFNKREYTESTQNDTYYLWIWLDEAETSTTTMNQTFSLSLQGSCTDDEKLYAPWGEEADTVTQVNFSQTSVQNGTNGLYLFEPTANDDNPVYYYRGAVDNNNVLFGGFCWKIVRTTSTGGTKLIYNGVPSDGKCTNTTGDATQISTSKFNTNHNSPADVGYMYGARYTAATATGTKWYYAPDVTYSSGTYALISKGSYNVETKSTIDGTNLNYHHYTCGNSTDTTCTSVKYVYYVSSSTAYYITLTNGKSVENALDEMLTSSSNTTDSTIKGVLDTWYQNNLSSYSTYLEDTIWCNDRSISSLNGWNPNGGDTTKYLYFSVNVRAYTTRSPIVTCPSVNDSFTVSNSNGNGKLTYPVGLLTADEIMMAGGKYGNSNIRYYLYTKKDFLTGSPFHFYYNVSDFYVKSSGSLTYSVQYSYGVRPAVSLKPGATWGGKGTSDEPYTVSYN